MKDKQKVKIFNKLYKDMQSQLKVVLKKTTSRSFSIETISQIETFSNQMDTYVTLFNTKDVELLKKVDLLSQFFRDKPALSSSNKECVWKFIETLYSLAKGSKQELVKQPEQFDINSIGSIVSNLMSDESNGFSALVKDISSKLEGTLDGKDIDQTKILQDLMSGKMESSGINFGNIISQATESLKLKVESGEIDINKISGVASGLADTLNLNKKS
jgi:hypothetical protein